MTDSDRERRTLRRVLAWVARWFPAETVATAVVVVVVLHRVGLGREHWADWIAVAFAILIASTAYGVVRQWTRRRITRRCSGPAAKVS
jgi:hypothetical protein